jgi:DNA-binding protein H-NS
MAEKEGNGGRKRSDSRGLFLEGTEDDRPQHNDTAVTGILDERIENLREAIEEIDDAVAGRKTLNREFIQQIDAEAEEVKRHLNMLQPPWKTGFYPEVEFLRLSFHKSLTSRAKERRTEELKYWENGVNLAKERRKFLDEYKALLATRRRLSRT